MPAIEPEKQVSLLFAMLDAMSRFKKEYACGDFYIDRDALTLVGSFTEEQMASAMGKYHAQSVTLKK